MSKIGNASLNMYCVDNILFVYLRVRPPGVDIWDSKCSVVLRKLMNQKWRHAIIQLWCLYLLK